MLKAIKFVKSTYSIVVKRKATRKVLLTLENSLFHLEAIPNTSSDCQVAKSSKLFLNLWVLFTYGVLYFTQ